jgi:hypothetical protein
MESVNETEGTVYLVRRVEECKSLRLRMDQTSALGVNYMRLEGVSRDKSK